MVKDFGDGMVLSVDEGTADGHHSTVAIVAQRNADGSISILDEVRLEPGESIVGVALPAAKRGR